MSLQRIQVGWKRHMATILIVDHRPSNRELLVTLLGYKGHRFLEASNGAEGSSTRRSLNFLVMLRLLPVLVDVSWSLIFG